jgi:hypothetical protein
MAVVVLRFAVYALSHIVFPFITGKGHAGTAKDHNDNNAKDVRCFHRLSPIVPKIIDIICQKLARIFDGLASMHTIVHPDEMRNRPFDGGHIRLREH